MLGRILLLWVNKKVLCLVKSPRTRLTAYPGRRTASLILLCIPCYRAWNRDLACSFSHRRSSSSLHHRASPRANVSSCHKPSQACTSQVATHGLHWLDSWNWSSRKRSSSFHHWCDFFEAWHPESPTSVSVDYVRPIFDLIFLRLIVMMGSMMILWYLVPSKRCDWFLDLCVLPWYPSRSGVYAL